MIQHSVAEMTLELKSMRPRVAYWTEVERGRVVGACRPFNPRGDIWNAPAEARLQAR